MHLHRSLLLRSSSNPGILRSLKRTPILHTRTWTTLTQSKDAITVHALTNVPFPYVWLRDACRSPQSVHPSNKQKLFKTSDIPLDIAPQTDGVKIVEGKIEITWNDGHHSIFDRDFLERYADEKKLEEWHYDQYLHEVSWTRSSISSIPSLFIPYQKILSTDQGLVDAITQLSKYGLLFVGGVPNQETDDAKCEVKKLAKVFGEIRKTFYGELWDVVNIKEGKNIAYTNLDLGLHMDLLYLQHPPRYQILHCLRNQVFGGTSIFVDALNAARLLQQADPAAFDILTKTPVSFHYINDGHHLHREHFTIELSPNSSDISQINYSPPFQAPLPLSTPREFYPALRKFADLLNNPINMYEYTLREGDAVLFDNRRVLHARTAFYDKPDGESGSKLKEGEPNRRLKGCYLEPDSLMDRVRVLRARLEKTSRE